MSAQRSLVTSATSRPTTGSTTHQRVEPLVGRSLPSAWAKREDAKAWSVRSNATSMPVVRPPPSRRRWGRGRCDLDGLTMPAAQREDPGGAVSSARLAGRPLPPFGATEAQADAIEVFSARRRPGRLEAA